MELVRALVGVFMIGSLWFAWWRGSKFARMLPMAERRRRGVFWVLMSAGTTWLLLVFYLALTYVTTVDVPITSDMIVSDVGEPSAWFALGLLWAYATLGLWMGLWKE